MFLSLMTLGQADLSKIEKQILTSSKLTEKQIIDILEILEYWVDDDVERVSYLLSKISIQSSSYIQARIELLRAEIYIRKKQGEIAQSKINEASKKLNKEKQDDFRLIIVQVLLHRYQNNFEEGKKLLERALASKDAYSVKEKCSFLIELALINLLMNNRIEALKILDKAESMNDAIKLDKFFLRIYNLRGLIYKNENYRVLAIENYLKSQKIIRNNNIVSKNAAITFMNLGNLYSQQSDTIYLRKAVQSFQEGLSISEQLKDTVQIIQFQERLGAVYLIQNQINRAFEYFESSMKLAEALHSQHLKIFLLITIASSYKHIGNTENAEKIFIKALEEAQTYAQFSLYIEACLYLSELYHSSKKFDTSLIYFNKGLELSRKEKLNFFLPDLYFYASSAYMKLGKYKEAESIIKEMEQLENKNLEQIYIRKMEKDSMQNNFNGAFYWARELEKLKENLFLKEKEDNFNESIEQSFLDLLKEEKVKRELQEQNEKNRLQKTLYLALLMLVIIIALVLFYFWERRKKGKWQKLSYKLQLREKDLEQIGEELKTNLEKLQNKSDFDKKLLAIVSHDLRGPIGSVAMLMDLLTQEYKEDKILFENLKVSKDTLYSSLELLENLIFWAKINQFDFEVNYEQIKLHDFIDDTLSLVYLQSKQKNLVIENLVDKNLTCYIEPNTIKLVLRNLVSNAIKFTEKGKIVINAFFENDIFKLIIADTGVGIHPDNLKKIFLRNFITLGTRKEKGSGLGLVLVKEFLEKIGGNISVQSELKVGTTFTVTIPKKV